MKDTMEPNPAVNLVTDKRVVSLNLVTPEPRPERQVSGVEARVNTSRSLTVHVHLVRSPFWLGYWPRLLRAHMRAHMSCGHGGRDECDELGKGQCFTPQLAVGCVDGPERTSGVAMTVRFNPRHPDDGAAELFTNPLIH